MSIKSIESKASNLVKELGKNKIPVDVEQIVKEKGLEIMEHDLGTNVSGVLFIDKGKGIIGFNGNESEVRKRFTIAHELGHFLLHRLDKDIFVDHKQFKAIFRDQDSSTGEIAQEREANAFAAALLMPKELLIKKIMEFPFDLADEEDLIGELAKKFNVSSQAMAFRVSNLNLF